MAGTLILGKAQSPPIGDNLSRYLDSLEVAYDYPLQERIQFFRKVYEAALSEQKDSLATVFALKAAMAYRSTDSLLMALHYAELAQAAVDETQGIYTSVLNQLGIIYEQAGDFERGLDYYQQALALARKHDPKWIVMPLGNIGAFYFAQGDYERALGYIREVNNYSKQLASPDREISLMYDYLDLSHIHGELGRSDSARYYATLAGEALSLLPHRSDGSHQAEGYKMLAGAYISLGMMEQASAAIDSLSRHADHTSRAEVEITKADYYLAQGNYEACLQAINRAKQDEEAMFPGSKIQLYRLEMDSYEGMGKSAAALDVAKKLMQVKQEQAETHKLAFAEFSNARYQNQQKQQRINTLKYEQQQQKRQYQVSITLLAVLGITFALLTLFYFYNNRQRVRFNKELREQVREKTKDLADKMETLKRFNYIVSHDLKEPLRSIVSFSGLARARLERYDCTDEALVDYLNYVTIGGQQLYRLLEDIQELQNADHVTHEYTETALDQVLQEIERSLSLLIKERNVLLHWGCLPTLFLPRAPLLIILKNLIENGIKYNKHHKPEIHIRYQQTEQGHELYIQDNGIGIEKEYWQKIFVMFKRLHHKSVYPGSGLGLALCRKLAQQLGGDVSIINSAPNVGTTFLLTLQASRP